LTDFARSVAMQRGVCVCVCVRERERDEKYAGSVVANDDVSAVHGGFGLHSSGGGAVTVRAFCCLFIKLWLLPECRTNAARGRWWGLLLLGASTSQGK